MKTIQTYMVRKPADLDEVKAITRANINRLETVTVAETVHLPPAWHAAVCQRPMNNYPFLSGKGWYAELSAYRANHYDELISLRSKIDSFYENIGL